MDLIILGQQHNAKIEIWKINAGINNFSLTFRSSQFFKMSSNSIAVNPVGSMAQPISGAWSVKFEGGDSFKTYKKLILSFNFTGI